MTIIEQIRAEIERRIHSIENCPFIEAEFGASEKRDGKLIAYKDLLSFLSTLESEKPMNQDGLEEEINRYLEPIHAADIQFEPFTQMTKCARHFANWQKEQYHFFNEAWADKMQYQLDRNYENGKQAMREQMMKEAVETTVHLEPGANPVIEIGVGRFGLKVKDKVRVIILPKED